MACMRHFVIFVACLNAAHAATTNAQEETCAGEHVKQQLLQARNSLKTKIEEEEAVASNRPVSTCPWHMTEGKGCHQESEQKAKCKDGTFSWSCNAGGHGERQQCPCTHAYMCAEKKCGTDGQDYCCEPSCEGFGGIRPCAGQTEVEPPVEPVFVPKTEEPTPEPGPTPSPTPAPKTCYKGFKQSFTTILDYAGIDVKGKSNDDQRNTCISYNVKHSKTSVTDYQGMEDKENQGAAAAILTLKANGYSDDQLKGITEDNQRNTLITLLNKCSGRPLSWIQPLITLDIAYYMNSMCCPSPPPKLCYPGFKASFTTILDYAGIDVTGKSSDDQRNTCISYNVKHSKTSVTDYQGMDDYKNQGAAAAIITLKANGYSEDQLKEITEDNQRNTLITLLNKCSGKDLSWIQPLSTLDIAYYMNSMCCP